MLIVFLVLFLSSVVVYAYGTVGPISSSFNETKEQSISEVTGSATIDPGRIRAGNTLAMLILAIMGVGLYGVLRYCKKNV